MANDIDTTLAERGERYGEFKEQARLAQGIKRVFQSSRNWPDMRDDMRETLDMLANKLGRILNGDPEFHDSWHDIIGYTTLVSTTLTPITPLPAPPPAPPAPPAPLPPIVVPETISPPLNVKALGEVPGWSPA